LKNMLALTILQPWATLIVLGHKTLERRTYAPLHRGTIAIHASSSRRGLEWAAHCKPLEDFTREIGLDVNALPMGAILGECQLYTITESKDNADLKANGWMMDGRYTWQLTGAIAYPSPVKAKGFVKLWPWDKPVA